MIKELLRLASLVLLIIIIIADDFPFYEKMKTPETQLFLAILTLLGIYFDPIFGLIFGVTLLVIYYEIYKKIIIKHEAENKDDKTEEDEHRCDKPIELDYITPEQLLAAQNNIFDVDNYNSEIKGVEHSMGIQGLNGGYDRDDKYSLYA